MYNADISAANGWPGFTFGTSPAAAEGLAAVNLTAGAQATHAVRV